MSDRPSFLAWLTCWLARCTASLIQVLPLHWNFALGSVLGRVAWHLWPGMRRITLANLEMAFGREWSLQQRRAIGYQHWQWLGANLLSGVKAAAMKPEDIARHVEIDIPEVVRARRREKPGGLVALISHQSCWELFAYMAHTFSEVPLGTIYQPLENPLMDAYWRKIRSRQGVRLFSRHEGLLETLAFLRNDNCLAILVDQHAGDSGVWTPLFDRLSATSPLAATLAIRSGMDLMPLAIQTIGPARWRIVASELIIPAPEETADALTARINLALEHQIRQSPADWLWVHERWKLPHPRWLLSGHGRGAILPIGYHAKQLQPFRLLVAVEDFAAVEAVLSIQQGRPDLEMTLAVPQDELPTWQILVPKVRLVGEADVAKLPNTFDAAVLLGDSIEMARLFNTLKIPRRVGFNREKLRPLLNQWMSVGKPESRKKRFLGVAEKLGASLIPSTLPTPLSGDLTTIFQQGREIFTLANLSNHLERLTEPGTTPEITEDGLLRIHSTFHSVRFVLHHLRLPAWHRIFLKIACERPYNDWMQAYYLTDTCKEFSVAKMVEKRNLAAGHLEEIFELPPDDLSGSLCITLGRGPAEYLIDCLEIRATPIAPSQLTPPPENQGDI